MPFKLPWVEKRIFWTSEFDIFPFFCKFLSDKVETVYWIGKAMHSKLFKSKFGHTKLFRKWFWNYLEFKSKIAFSPFCLFLTDNIEIVFLKLWKWYWSVFCKFLSYEVATVFSKSEAKHWKLFKSEVGHMKHFRKWFGSYLEVKNEIAFSLFCKFLSDNIEIVFEKARQTM